MAGGTSPFNYNWSSGSTASSAVGLCAGNYCVTVTDVNTCTSVSCITITEPPPITLTIVPVNVLCAGNCTGSANLTVSGGTPSYTYLWSNALNAEDLTNLCAGTFTVTVTDASGATASNSVTITEPAAVLSATASVVNVTCNGLCNGSASITPAGGTLSYTYAWSGGGTSSTKNSLCAGNFTVTVTDNNGCTAIVNGIVTQPSVLTASSSVTDASCNGSCNGSATVTPAGGTSPYTYAWNGGGTSSTKSGLCAGNHTVTVTDNKGCTVTANIVVNQPAVLTATSSVNNVTCNGLCNGSATVTPSGGTSPYNYLWSGGGTASVKSGLCAGNHTVTVTDNKGCTVTALTNVTQPVVLTVTATGGTATCFGSCNGTATASPAGGTIPYLYVWSNGGQTGATATGYCAGNYTVTVTDSKSCTATANVTVNQPLAVTVSVTTVNSNCSQSNGSATANAGNGVIPYTYLWDVSAGSQTTSTATGLMSGNYNVTVTDANGCSATATASVADNTGPVVTILSSSDISCFGGFTGTATVLVTDGQPPYTYLWSPSGQTTSNATGLPAGNHSVLVTDVNGCNSSVNVSLTQPTVLSVSITSNNITCNGLCNGSATASGSGGVLPYAYSWSNGSTNSSVTGLCTGTFTVTITDNNGCSATANTNITQPVILSVSVSGTNVTCNGSCNGNANANPSGGTSPYTYLWSNGSTGTITTGLCAGAYTVTISDSKGCSVTGTVNVTQPSALSASISSQNDVTCNGQCNGFAQVSVSQGTSPYSYSWSNGQTNPLATGLCTGTFTVTATDANSCTATTQVIITQPAAISISLSATNVSCYGNSDGSTSVTASGGTAPYQYQWNDLNLQTTSSATGLDAGTFNLSVTDSKGCSVTGSISVTEPLEITLSFSTNGSNCNQADGSATVTVSSGSNPPFSYLWSANAASQTTNTASSLSAGSYTVTVTDAVGCTSAGTVTVSDLGSPSLSILSQGDASCNGSCDGFASVLVTGGTPPYSYTWNSIPAQTTATATGLCAGNYICNVVDPNNCNANIGVAIGQPSLLNLTIVSPSNASCFGLCDGQSTALASGGTSPYSYLWNDPFSQATQTATGLCPGNYSVAAVDDNGCTSDKPVTISQPAIISLTINPVDAHCGQPDGSALASASGGNGSYGYSWNNGQNNPNAVSLTAGSYTVTVTDIKGCTTTGSATVNNIPAGTAVITVTNPVSCYGNSNGSLAVSVAGATPPLSYLWSNGGIQSAVTGLSSGVFYVSATDFFGCLSTDSFNLTQPAQISILTGDGSEDCFGDCSGKVTATPSGGVSPFSYLWDDPLASQNIYAENLCAGTYNVTVTDNNGCAQTASASVTSPTPVSLSESHTDATCGAANGTGTVTASGGVTPYSYQWPAGQTTSAVNNLFAGTYLITVTDNTGCSSTILVPVSNPSGLNVIVLSSDSVNCNGGNDGSVVISVSGGTMPYTYQWNDPLNQTAPNAANLPAGTWIVTVTDATACQTGAPVTIFEPAPLGFSLTAVNPQCDGDCNGSASVTVSGGTPPYSYLWDDPQSQTISSPAGLCSGTVNLIITDANGCNELSVITLFDPLPMSVVTTVTSTICGPGCSGTASAFTTNGVSPFTYQWNDPANQLTQTAVNLCSGTYLVTVTDDDGCSFISSATVSQPATVTVSMASIGNNACYGNCSGWAQADATGGSPPYIYLWSNGQNLSQAINLCSGTYTVTVTDSSGCQDITGVTITQPLLLGGSITSNDISCYGACDGNAAVNISGGTSPYSYLWDDPSFQTTSSATGLCSGIFTLTVTDTNGCQQIFSVQITEPSPLTFTSSAIPSSCGNNNGQACLSVSGGEFPYVITWNDPYTQVGSCAFNLQAGAYIATIGDANGCVVSGPVTVNDISGVNIDSVIFNDVTCNGDSDGWAIVYVTGIAPPFTYLWKRGAVTVGTGSNITGLSGGNYTITVWDTNNCSNSSAIPVFEPTPPGAAVISKTNANCSGSCDGTAQAMAGGGITPYTFMWDGVQTTSNATGLCAGSHILEVTDGNGCQVILNAVITEPDPVLVSPTVTPITCSGTCNGMISLLPGPTGGTPYYLYQWTPLVGYGPSVSNLCPNQYIVVVTDVKGCTGGDTVLITDPLPLIADSITNPSTCGGDNGSAAVIASGGTVPYTYLWPDGQTNAIVTNLEARDPYWVTITDAVGCVTVIPVTVDDIPGPDNITVTATNLLCYNDNSGIAVAVVSGGTLPYTHSWPSGPDNDTITGLPAGVFIVTVSDANGCTITGGVSVTQPNLVFAMNVQPDTICFGQTGSVYASFNGGSPPYTYYWYDDGFPSTQGPHQVNPVSATDYEVYVEDANGCLSDTQVVSIAVRPQLTVSASSAGNICIGSSTVVTAFVSGGNNGPYSYLWSNNSPNQSITVSPSVSTTYTVTVTDGCSQPETASATVNINPYPAPAFTLSNLGGCTPFSVQVFDGSTISAGSIVSWYWQVSDGQTSTDQNPVFLFTNSGVNTVTLTVTSNMGCASSYTGINQITIYQSPAAYFTPVPGETTILWANIKFIDGSSAGVTSWSWDFGDTASGDLNYDTVENPVHTYDAIGNYIITLTVESSDGCVGAYADEVIVKEDYVLFAPNAFTPDGDGRNDYFLPEGLGIDPNNFTLYIYSRWGDLIYRTSDLNKPWDGKANNGTGLVQQDVYVWIITTSDPDGNNHKYVGHVTLVK
ncbi:MAG: gliding motility-associated C-terminal domain-containing protein [Bacteroidetes bacterium]|nr:gliding motility-associated C-terminal domain-containing protein [Bacteroidota bacterium]